MTDTLRNQVKTLIPDLLPPGHVPLNYKRVRFIKGEGVVLYDDKYQVEIYRPRFAPSGAREITFFGVQRHHGHTDKIYSDYKRPRVMHINDPSVTPELRSAFEEAVFQFEPIEFPASPWIFPTTPTHQINSVQGKEIMMQPNISGAA